MAAFVPSSNDFLSDLPDALILTIFFDNEVPILDPFSLAAVEIAGGSVGRVLIKNTENTWEKFLEYHFRWITGRPNLNMIHKTMKAYVLDLWAKLDITKTQYTSHVLLVGGNCDREITFAEEPMDDTSLIRDNPSLFSYSIDQLRTRFGNNNYGHALNLFFESTELKIARSSCAAVRRPTDRAVFVLGGWDGDESLDTVEHLSFQIHQPSREALGWSWDLLEETMHQSRCFLGAAVSQDGKVWALGGGDSLWQNAACFNSTEFFVEEFEKSEEEEEQEEREGGGERSLSKVNGSGGGGELKLKEYTISQDKKYVSMGNQDDHDDENDKDDDDSCWDTEDEDGSVKQIVRTWKAGPDMNELRCGLGACSDFVNNNIYVAGGYGGGTIYHNSAEVLDLDQNCPEWIRLPNMSYCRTGCGVSMGPDGCVYVVGGSPDGSNAHRTGERFDPREGKWHDLPLMTVGRGYCSATFTLSKLLMASGGMNGEGKELCSCETFDIVAHKWSIIKSTHMPGHATCPRADHASLFVDYENEEFIM